MSSNALAINRMMTREQKRADFKKRLKQMWPLYLFILPTLAYIILFCYVPMYGIVIAFQDFTRSMTS